jgi:Uma2 family endonuclease
MATTSTGIMSWEDFERLPSGDGYHREILEGELQVLPPAKSGHSLIAGNTAESLRRLQKRRLGRVLSEAGYKLSQSPPTWVQPDVSFLTQERIQTTDENGYFIGAPELAIEIVSPSESGADIQRKVTLLLAAGSKAVWLIYPKTKTVQVHLPDGTAFTRGISDTLSAPFLLAGWEFPVAQLFAD